MPGATTCACWLEPIEVQASASFTPLRLADVSDLDAGHAAEERDDPPTERAS